jgi:ABC-type uncharacterized transport system involved in gliding motility auxiliary subunit
VIPALNPQREQFLEYDVSELIYGVGQTEKKKLGLITSLPLQGSPGMPMMGQQGTEGQFVVSEWEDTYQIVPVEAAATDLPAGLDVLAVIHPENLTPKLQFAIDQFLLSGKPVFLAVDPSSLYFKRQGGQAAMFGGPQPSVSSDLPVLLGGWGVAYDPQKVVGDLENAEEVELRDGSRVRYPVWINLTQEDFNPKALPTAQLGSALFIEAGAWPCGRGRTSPSRRSSRPPSQVRRDPDASAPVRAARRGRPPGDAHGQEDDRGPRDREVQDGVSGRRAEGPEPANPDKKDDKAGAKARRPGRSRQSKTSSILIIVADTDWLFDDYSVRKFNFMGRTAASRSTTTSRSRRTPSISLQARAT